MVYSLIPTLLPPPLSSVQIQSEGDPPSAVRPAEPAAGRAAEPAVGAAAMPPTHQSCKTLAPSAPTPRTPRGGPAAGPNPPRSPPSPKRPPAQRPPGLRRNNTSHRRWAAIDGHFVCTSSSFWGRICALWLTFSRGKDEDEWISLSLFPQTEDMHRTSRVLVWQSRPESVGSKPTFAL